MYGISNEKWKWIRGYVNQYQASNFGRIRSVDRVGVHGQHLRGKIIEPNVITQPPNARGECLDNLTIGLYSGGRTHCRSLANIIAETFIENKHRCKKVEHIDGDPYNNAVENLQWLNRTSTLSEQPSKEIHHYG